MASMKQRIDAWTTRTLSYLHRRFLVDDRRQWPMRRVYERAAESSAIFIEANMDDAVLFDHRVDYWAWLAGRLPRQGLLIECGVFEGKSINFIADRLRALGDPRLIHGFDSFEGLEEDWSGEALPAGHFDRGGRLPPVRDNVRLHKGWVQDTVQPFLDQHPGEPLALLHIDTDTYTPARFLLDTIAPRLVPGSIIAFDELIGYPNWPAHEAKALAEALPRERYRFIAFTSRQAAIRIL